MRIFYDTEFIEDGRVIDLISIGMVREDGATYYAISNECDLSRACPWVQENVISKLEAPSPERNVWKSRATIRDDLLAFCSPDGSKLQFWAYYADYDHVALCQLFGRMNDLPQGWPMFTYDLKQLAVALGNPDLPEQTTPKHHALDDALWTRDCYEWLRPYRADLLP